MGTFQAAYVPVGVGTFHMESAEDLFVRSVSALQSICPDVRVPDKKEDVLTTFLLGEYLDKLEPDLIILQNLTFANAAYTYEVMRRFPDVPVILWTLREPTSGDGGRLKLNSLTGAFSAANAYRAFRDTELLYVLGDPEEDEVRRAITAAVSAAHLRVRLKSLRIAAIGHTPQGFGFGRALDQEMMSVFGSELVSIEARELIKRASELGDDKALPLIGKARERMTGLENIPEENVRDFAKLWKVYEDYIRDNGIGAVASRCWPDFFTDYGTPVCAVLSLINDGDAVAACESDTYGALSMFMARELTGVAAFFGDPVSVDEADGTVTFWHCGMAPCSLARRDTGACVGVHPNRKIGPTMEFGCRPSEAATVFRVGRTKDGSFRMLIAEGSIEDRPKQFLGTSVVVRTDAPAGDLINRAVKAAWEPHFVVAYGRIGRELESLAAMLGIEVWR